MLKFGTPTIALPLAIKNVLFRLDALYMSLFTSYNYCVRVRAATIRERLLIESGY